MKLHEEKPKKKKLQGCYQLPGRHEVEKSPREPKMNPMGWLFSGKKKK